MGGWILRTSVGNSAKTTKETNVFHLIHTTRRYHNSQYFVFMDLSKCCTSVLNYNWYIVSMKGSFGTFLRINFTVDHIYAWSFVDKYTTWQCLEHELWYHTSRFQIASPIFELQNTCYEVLVRNTCTIFNRHSIVRARATT